jgi:hypothetical protein
MCMKCNGWSDQEIREWYLEKIKIYGWVITFVGADEHEASFAYTIGLTRFHGHPELMVSGLDQADSQAALNQLGAEVGSGAWFTPGQVIRQSGRHRYQFVDLNDPGVLVEAQQMYASEAGLVPGLQIVYTDHYGRWPWDPRWPSGALNQPLFGVPAHR